MTRRIRSLLFIIVLLASTNLLAQSQSEIQVEDIAVCTSIDNRVPVGTADSFSADVGKLYCYTKLKSESDMYTISHVWFYNDKQMAKIDLSVKAKSWRTWSAKTIIPAWNGSWRVEVHDSDGKVISKIPFEIK